MRRDKKNMELALLNAVLTSLGAEVSTDAILPGERPDFLIALPSGTVGVEVTRLHHLHAANGERAREGASEAILTLASRMWRERGLPSVHVSVTFERSRRLPKKAWRALAQSLVESVTRGLPIPGRQSVLGVGGPPWLTTEVPPPPEVRTVIISRTTSSTLFSLSSGGAAPFLTDELVQSAVDKKRELLESYRKRADQVWLILGVDDGDFSSQFTLDDPEALLERGDLTGFARVFLVSIGRGFVVEFGAGRGSRTSPSEASGA